MRKFFRTVVIVAALPCWSLSGGVAMADPPNLEDVTDQFQDTPDGEWRLHVSLYDMNITSVPNMAATAFTREAFVSATAEVWVEPLHPERSIQKGSYVNHRSISLWLEKGCQANLQTTTLQANNSSQNSLQETSSTGTGPTGASTGTGTNLVPNTGQAPQAQINQTLKPGTINYTQLDSKEFPDLKRDPKILEEGRLATETEALVGQTGWPNDKLTVTVRNWDLKVDSCAGPVSFRFQARAIMNTDNYGGNADAYSTIVQV